ncbi:hypothetical protein B0H10DRAFT_2186210 [Mycena sp. CBHHK59/15]|nr:hypothetical protein B0H10DRAFT_2186210 [Mycena sp. CBHHK59/15]
MAPESLEAIVQQLKHHIVELEAQLQKDAGTKTPASVLKSYASLGRSISKVVLKFDSIDSLIAEHDWCQDLEESRASRDDVHGEEEQPTAEFVSIPSRFVFLTVDIRQDRLYRGYKELIRFIPPLCKALVEADHQELTQIITMLRNGSRNARSDDTKNLWEAIVPWLNRDYPSMDPALEADSRDNRGIYHDTLGRVLCPIEYDWNNEETRMNIREGHLDFPLTAHSWFSGLYPEGQFDPNDPEKGLFRNVTLLMTYKFIFTSPLSVKTMVTDNTLHLAAPRQRRGTKKAAPKSKQSVAAIIGLNRVSGRSIAYAAVQYHVALSDTNHWDNSDGAFDYILFYNNVVDYLEAPPRPVARLQVAQLLDWWNSFAFRAARSTAPLS